MNKISTLFVCLSMACLPAAARGTIAQETGGREVAASPAVESVGCTTKGCPAQDQFGNPPLSCAYISDLSTGWQCIVICTYKTTSWGTKVDSDYCK